MKALVGLGNPGSRYEATRHNLGFLVADAVAGPGEASSWKRDCRSLVKRLRFCGQDLVVLKPQTFMNDSGLAVADLVRSHGVSGEDLIVAHDDLDIPWGCVRVKIGGGHGGHRGIESILAEAEAGEFVRLRLGVKPEGFRGDAAEFVLRPFGDEDWPVARTMVADARKALERLLTAGVTRAMTEFNRKAVAATPVTDEETAK